MLNVIDIVPSQILAEQILYRQEVNMSSPSGYVMYTMLLTEGICIAVISIFKCSCIYPKFCYGLFSFMLNVVASLL